MAARTVEGDARPALADGEFDRIIAAEILEHIPEDEKAIAELFRVLAPGGVLAVTVPRFAEKINWMLSDAYHVEVEGGHVRIYKEDELTGQVDASRLHRGGPLLRPRPALAVLVAQVRGRRRQRRQSARQGLSPAPRLGHHAGADPDSDG